MKTLKINIKKLPGIKSEKVLGRLKNLNGAVSSYYPFAFSGQGQGPYFKDLDGNTFLDFASNIASTPLGYNHPKLLATIKHFSKHHPVKYAGQDFALRLHADFIEELLSITKGMNRAFLVNSGAEAVENCIKIAMRSRPKAKYGLSFDHAFHGRTLGALSLTHSKPVHKKNYLAIPTQTLSFSEHGANELESLIKKDSKESIAFVILEHIQGEGGYNPAPRKMVTDIRKICRENSIPYIADEVQSGMGRTGEWWAFENFNIKPDIFSSAKALQVGAVVSTKDQFPQEEGAISSTWGGGQIIDMAVGIETIKTIKRDKLLTKNNVNGRHIMKRMQELSLLNPRGIGLMCAFDMQNKKIRNDIIIECITNGLVVIGCGERGIRLIPPYIIEKNHIAEAFRIIESAIKKCTKQGFKHSGKICHYLDCGTENT